MRLALAASAFVHLCVAAALLPVGTQRSALPAAPAIPARLVLAEAPLEPATPVPKAVVAAPARQHGEAGARARPVPELLYYAAGELDVLPRPLAALDLHRLGKAAEGASGIRAVLKIDEHGLVKDVEIANAGRPAREALRAELAVTRFAPALKDGRPVRSRIVLDFRFAAD